MHRQRLLLAHVVTEPIAASVHHRPNAQSLSIKEQSSGFNQMSFSGRVFNYTPQTSHVQPPLTQGSHYQPPIEPASQFSNPVPIGLPLTRPEDNYQLTNSARANQNSFGATIDRVKETTIYTKQEGIFSQLEAKPLHTTAPPVSTSPYTSLPPPTTSSPYTSTPSRSSQPLFTH